MGFGALQVLTGATKLSELAIDISQNWLAYLIKNIGAPVADQDACTKKYADDIIGGITKLSELGIDVDKDWLTHLIKNIGAPVAAQDAATKAYVDARVFSLTQSEPARSLGTVYRNTGLKPLFACVTVEYYISSSDGDLTGTSWIGVNVEDADPPTSLVATGGILHDIFGLSAVVNLFHGYATVTSIVPPSWYYKVYASSSGDGFDPTLVKWLEWS